LGASSRHYCLLQKANSDNLSKILKNCGHAPKKHGKWIKCSTCGCKSLKKGAWKWLAIQCSGNKEDIVEVAVNHNLINSPEIVNATFPQFQKLSREVAKENAACRKQNSSCRGAAKLAILKSLPAAGSSNDEVTQSCSNSVLPEWAGKFHGSHCLFHVGGFVFCTKCGSAISTNRKCVLWGECNKTLAEGSQPRINKLKDGRCISGLASWPDGRPKHARLHVHKVDSGCHGSVS
jgi:hypothetical protein